MYSNLVKLNVQETMWFKLLNRNISAMSFDFQQQQLTIAESIDTICKGIDVLWHKAIGKVSWPTKKGLENTCKKLTPYRFMATLSQVHFTRLI